MTVPKEQEFRIEGYINFYEVPYGAIFEEVPPAPCHRGSGDPPSGRIRSVTSQCAAVPVDLFFSTDVRYAFEITDPCRRRRYGP